MRHWLRGAAGNDAEAEDDLKRFGAQPEQAREFIAAQDADDPPAYKVWPDAWEPLAVFLRLKRQWRLHPYSGAPIGLDNTAIPPTLDLMGIPRARWPALFDLLQTCEQAALTANER